MASVFTPCYGAVEVALNCGGEKVFEITFDGGKVDGIITGMALEMSGNYQFLHTVDEFVYFYAFGDRVGVLNVNGIGFVRACPRNAGTGSLLKLYEWYMGKRAVKSGGKAMNIRLIDETGYVNFYGFLTGMRIGISDTPSGFLGDWALKFDVLPKDIGGV